MTASLYTRIARPCAPCPAHAHKGPRDHFYVKPPPPPVPFEMEEPAKPRVVGSMSPNRRVAAYRAQMRGRSLTGRQKRQILRMAFRAAYQLGREAR